MTTLGATLTEEFDSLANTNTGNTWTNNTTIPGFFSSRTTYNAGTGSSNAGALYSFGAASNTERALGSVGSGSTGTIVYGARLTNNTGSTITSLDVSYVGEQWRSGGSSTATPSVAQTVDFQYRIANVGEVTDIATGTWVDFNSLDFTSPIFGTTAPSALDGNLAANRTALSATINSIMVLPGQEIWLRWRDIDHANNDHGLAIDELDITPQGGVADSAPSVSSTDPAASATNVALNSDVMITFSEPVNATGSSFTIVGSSSGSHTFMLSGGATTFTLNPDTDFVNNETVTVTVVAAQVTDQDINDPPDQMAANFSFSFNTPVVLVCGDPATLIHTIQGINATNTMNGAMNVVIEGIVVGDYQAAGQFGGYYVQEEDDDVDSNPATSEGIFVFNTSFPVNVGDKVRVRGTIGEFTSSGTMLTQMTNVTAFSSCGSGSVTPATVMFPVMSISDLERYEGMLINIPQELTVTDNFTLGRFGEVGLSVNGRLFNPTHITMPGAAAIAQQDLNDRSRIVLDDGNNQQNIDPTLYPSGGLSAANTLRLGYTVNGLTGVLDQRFGLYRVQPVGAISFVAENPRPTMPDSVGGTLKVASLNVLNYFNGNGMGGGFPTSRGATTAAEFTRQRDKIISAITTINADVAGLIEIENDAPPNSAVEDLVNGLNAATAPGTYAFINTGVVGTDEIRVALIYKPATVTPVGSFAILNSMVDPMFIDTKNRPALAQTFMQNSGGGKFTVVVNHFKSKGSDCNDVGDPDTGDGQGNCNETRTKAATALVNWLATDPTGSGDPDFLIVGDLNAYAMEDPITVIESANYTNLIEAFVGADAYSFQFEGQSGYLDHALANACLAPQVTGATEWHVNADEPIVLDYNVEFKTANQINTFYSPGPFRMADHDPVVVGLNLTSPLGCPEDITVSNDPGSCGAIVNYAAPTGGGCGDVVCSPESGSFFAVGTTTVTCSVTGSTCMFNVTVNDTEPPVVNCPSNITAVTAIACPPPTGTVVNFDDPGASDNCNIKNSVCTPSSGSIFAVGTTTVTCTFTDDADNTSMCSFTVTVFNACLQDDTNPGTTLLFNVTTGDYMFCCNGVTYTGRATVTKKGCSITLAHNDAERKLSAKIDYSAGKGAASIKVPNGQNKCDITDRDISNNTCSCGVPQGGGPQSN